MVELTDLGNHLARNLERRHKIIKDFFVNILSVDSDISEEDACKLEHYISTTVLDSLVSFVDFIKNKPEWLGQLKNM